MSEPGQKYFKLRVYVAGKEHHLVVWDGVRDYENQPAIEGLAATGQFGAKVGKLGIVQIRNGRIGRRVFKTLFPTFDNAVLWTRNHAVYSAIVNSLREQSDFSFEGLTS